VEHEHLDGSTKPNVRATIISDLHLGSKFSQSHHFENFLKTLPEGFDLILNGDVVDKGGYRLTPSDRRILELIVQESFRRKVVWVRGNHDSRFVLEKPGSIFFKQIYTIGKRLLIAHGHGFDKYWGTNRAAVSLVYFMTTRWSRLGGKEIDLARFARKFKIFDKFCQDLMRNAVQYARQNGFGAVTCGHTHYPEDMVFDGIRYINTGSWTECPPFYLLVDNEEITLKTLQPPP
jgi:UDP-2,3-diacylglucosamine pyrophosphatase LpxH